MRTYVIRKLISVFIGSVVITLAVLPTPASNAVAAEAGPNEGLVIFHRKSSMKGKAIRFNLEQDGIPIGQLLSGTTIERPLPPGNYVFSVRAPSLDGMDVIHINVEAGRTYHVWKARFCGVGPLAGPSSARYQSRWQRPHPCLRPRKQPLPARQAALWPARHWAP